MSSKSNQPRVVFITGSSSGFGRLLVEVALANGDNVVATLRKPEALKDLQDHTPADRLLVLKLDVTKHDEIIDAFAQAKKKFGRVDVVFNNAGYAIYSVVENTPDDRARTLFETNFWGAVHVNQEAVRFFRDENPKGAGGRLIVISSLVGLLSAPGVGFYAATKHALEAITQALSGEVDKSWNIKVTIVEPGNFRTRGVDVIERIPIPESYLAPDSGVSQMLKLFAEFTKPGGKTGDAHKAVQKMYELTALENPPLRFPIGKEADLAMIRNQLDSVAGDLKAYESWSADVLEN